MLEVSPGRNSLRKVDSTRQQMTMTDTTTDKCQMRSSVIPEVASHTGVSNFNSQPGRACIGEPRQRWLVGNHFGELFLGTGRIWWLSSPPHSCAHVGFDLASLLSPAEAETWPNRSFASFHSHELTTTTWSNESLKKKRTAASARTTLQSLSLDTAARRWNLLCAVHDASTRVIASTT
jgi:hypothetical protein